MRPWITLSRQRTGWPLIHNEVCKPSKAQTFRGREGHSESTGRCPASELVVAQARWLRLHKELPRVLWSGSAQTLETWAHLWHKSWLRGHLSPCSQATKKYMLPWRAHNRSQINEGQELLPFPDARVSSFLELGSSHQGLVSQHRCSHRWLPQLSTRLQGVSLPRELG